MKAKIFSRNDKTSTEVLMPHRLFKKFMNKDDYILNRDVVVMVN